MANVGAPPSSQPPSDRSVCDRGFGPSRQWRAYHHVVDHFAALTPDAPAVEDDQGVWSYAELRAKSVLAASFLRAQGLARHAAAAPCWAERPAAPRPLAAWVARGREFAALCVGAWRLGLPVLALSRDMADKGTESSRNEQALAQLNPLALVADERAPELLSPHRGVQWLPLSDLLAALRGDGAAATQQALEEEAEAERAAPVGPESVLAYVYIGGTTKASKCVTVTHAMALWEAESYSTALGRAAGLGDRFLQYSSLYWGAAVFGQISIGLAVGGCVCFGGCPQGCSGSGDALRQLVQDTERFRITILGVVPSQLRGAWPDGPSTAPASLHTIVVWADKCPVELSRLWQSTGKRMVDLLIASEYWLALYSDCRVWTDGTVQKHVYRALPSLEARFLVVASDDVSVRDASPGEVGEMYLAGPTTSPGYVCPDGTVGLHFHEASRVMDGRAYLRTRDKLLLLHDGGLVYSGRADSMMKHGGQWVDADALQDALMAMRGVAQAAVLPSALGVDAFVVLTDTTAAAPDGSSDAHEAREAADDGSSPVKRQRLAAHPAPFRLLAHVRRALPSSTPGGCRIHLRTSVPLNAATAKIDRKALTAELQDIHECQRQHVEVHAQLELAVMRHYQAWAVVAVAGFLALQLASVVLRRAAAGVWCAARGLPAAASAAPGFDLVAAAAGGVELLGTLAGRLLALPQLWLAATYLQDGGRGWSHWLPLLLAATLPPAALAVLAATAVAYLAHARERDRALALGLAAATVALAASVLGGQPAGWTAAALLALAALSRWRAACELLALVALAPGLFYPLLPKYLQEEFGRTVEQRWLPSILRGAAAGRSWWAYWGKRLRRPRWPGGLRWVEAEAVVDAGNHWNLVTMVADGGGSAWNSIGIRLQLNSMLAAAPDSPLAPLLYEGGGQANGHSTNGVATAGVPSPVGGGAADGGGLAGALAAIVERICGECAADALHALDSMQAIQLSEAVRREFRRPLAVSDVLRCHDVAQLVEAVQGAPEMAGRAKANGKALPQAESRPWRVWLCGMSPRNCTVDWMVSRQDRAKHLDVLALQRAVDRLVARHAALRARNAAEVPMFDATYTAASLWQLWSATGGPSWPRGALGRLASRAVFQAWPRTEVLPEGKARVALLQPAVGEVAWADAKSDDERAFWSGGALLQRAPPGELFHVCVIPVFAGAAGAPPESNAVEVALTRPPEEVRWYIYAVLDHGYCDGPTGAPLFADLLRLYAEESGEAFADGLSEDRNRHPAEALAVLERRLQQSLKPMPEAEHPNNDIFHDGLISLGYRRGYQRHIRFDAHLMRLLRVAARDLLGCSVDVAWLTCIAAAFFRQFPKQRRLDLYLIVTCRDGAGEEAMIGYFSSRKLMPLETGDPSRLTLLGLADMISSARRQRAWRRPRPFEKADAIEVNIVSQAADGLPLGFQEVRCSRSGPRDWNRGGTSNLTLRLDQTARDDWDFRLQSHDASWGDHWSTFYAQALGSVLVDMALHPCGPVVPQGAEAMAE